jgi:hypothetical protein
MATFQSRLLSARSAGSLTVADLSHWFSVPFSTVKYWCTVGNPDLAPRGPRGREIIKRLKQLEWAIEHRIGMPVPDMMNARDRPSHIMSTRDAINERVPPSNFTA